MRFLYAFIHRNALRGLALVAALGGLQINDAHAIRRADMGYFKYSSGPSNVTIKPNQAGTTGSQAPIGSIPTGQVGSQIGNSGWYHGTSASGQPSSGTTMHLGHNGDVFVAGTKYPFQAGYKVEPTDLAAALLGMVGGPWTAAAGATMLAMPHVINWIEQHDRLSVDDDTGQIMERTDKFDLFCQASQNYQGSPAVGSTSSAGCGGATGTVYVDMQPNATGQSAVCSVRNTCHPSVVYASWGQNGTYGAEMLPKSMDDIAPYLNKRPTDPAGTLEDILNRGGDIPLGQPELTGPTELKGPKTTTKNADGTETVTQPVTKYQITNNTINITNTTTTTTTTNTDGTVKEATETKVEPPPETEADGSTQEKPDLCEKYPDILACSKPELDTPEEDIPTSEKELTYTEEDNFGGGTCPADVFGSIGGQQYKLYDWQQTCAVVQNYLRPLILLLGAMGALFILIPGRDA
jgi:hypothetical protein